jgi:hypothetical protein
VLLASKKSSKSEQIWKISTDLLNRRTCLRRLNRVCSELDGELDGVIWLAWNLDEFEGCDIAEQLGWLNREAFYTLVKSSELWDSKKGAFPFLQALLDKEGKYEVHESSKWRHVKWYAFSLKGLAAPSMCPQQQWYPVVGGIRRRLSLNEHTPTRRPRGSTAGTALERLMSTPPLAFKPPVEEMVTYNRDRHSKSSKLQGVEFVRIPVSELKSGRKPNDAERYAALEVINAARGNKTVAELRSANNKPVTVAVLTTTRGNSDVSSLSK